MYQVDVLLNNGWKYFDQCYSKYELDIIVREIMKKMPEHSIRVLEDDKILVFLDGSQYKYQCFKNRYILDKGIGYDNIKEYYKKK